MPGCEAFGWKPRRLFVHADDGLEAMECEVKSTEPTANSERLRALREHEPGAMRAS